MRLGKQVRVRSDYLWHGTFEFPDLVCEAGFSSLKHRNRTCRTSIAVVEGEIARSRDSVVAAVVRQRARLPCSRDSGTSD